MNKKIFALPLLTLLLSSCSFTNATKDYAYLNHKYVLNDAGDLHGLNPESGTVMRNNKGFTSYTNLFDKKNSYIDFQCKGTNKNDFHCETTFYLLDKKGSVVYGSEDYIFNTRLAKGYNNTTVVYENENDQEKFGSMYVYIPYWVRWQFEYDVNGDGNKVLLTFEFWKSTFNEVPEWSK